MTTHRLYRGGGGYLSMIIEFCDHSQVIRGGGYLSMIMEFCDHSQVI